MANPTLSGSFNKTVFAPGEMITATITYGDTDNQSITLTVVATDASGNSSAPVTITANIADPVTLALSSLPARTWTKVNDTGAVAVYTAVA